MQDILDMTVPIVVETSGRTERAYDIFSRLLKDRIVLLGSEVNDAVASLICAQLLFLESQDPEKEIYLYINSPGGSVTAGMAIYDTMNYITPPIATVCMGRAASMGAFLLSAGQKGMRYALPNSQVMIHQPLGGFQGQATDIDIHAREILRMRETLNGLLAKHTGQPIEKIAQDTERDNFMTAEEAQPGLAEVYPTATVQDLNGTSVVAFHDAEEDVLGIVVMDTVDAGYYIFMFTPASDEAFLPVADAIAASFTAAQ